ncbi:response regulator [Singulisphaera sp. PoT]|uniref:hybrid sensor histidine kinase/response regulator n=1 Tax=Singulisphaera sp. PoT TaxID=3411797 RepID=UPI003BF6078B
MKNNFTGKVGTWFFLSVVITATIAFGLYGAIDRSSTARRNIEHTLEIVRSLRKLHDVLIEAIMTARSYTMRPADATLQKYREAVRTMATEIRRLQKLPTVTDAQRIQIATMEDLLTERLAMLDSSVERKRTKAPAPPDQMARFVRAEQITQQIRQILGEMQAEQNRFSMMYSQTAAHSTQRAITALFAGMVTNLAILTGVFYLFGREIMRRQLMDETLRQSEERFRGAFDVAVVGMTIATPEGRFLQVNRSFCETLGYTEEELLGKDFRSITHPDDLRTDSGQFERVLGDGARGYHSEQRYIHKDGHPVWIHRSISLVRDSKGQPVHFVGLSEDITLRKQSQEAMARAKEAAESAVAVKAAFLANMSHEIRTPMNGVLGVAELLLETPLDSIQRDYAATIRNSADALLTIINDILDLSKIEAGKMVIDLVEFDLRTLMEEVADLLAPRAHQKGLQINCRIPASFPQRMVGDPVRLRQILTNLVGNAVKFTVEGEVSLEAQFEAREDEDSHLRIVIRDTGIGIPEEQHEAIFEGFTQADIGTDRRYGGTGLGLTICRQLARLMGGEIGLESEVGRGSTFWLELPLPKASTMLVEPAQQGQCDLEGLRILIIDENATNRRVLREHLQSWGCRTEEVDSGAAALRQFQADHAESLPSLIFVDENLAKIVCDRFNLMKRTVTSLAAVPLLLVRSVGRNDHITNGTLSCFKGALTKPVRRSQLLNTLLDALASRHEAKDGHQEPKKPLAPPTGECLGLRVLVADDHAVNRKVALRMLEQLGCVSEAVENGMEAVERLEHDTWDLILMDVQMPVLDGLEATRQIRRRELESGRERVSILALTAHAMDVDKRRCLAAGMDGHVTKPVKRQELLSALSQFARPRPEELEPEATDDDDGTVDGGIPIFGVETLLENCDGDEEMVREIIESFLATAPGSIESLEEALYSRDADRIAAEAHGLKGSCLTLRASALAEVCKGIESLDAEGNPAGLDQSAGLLRHEWMRLRNTLENLYRINI